MKNRILSVLLALVLVFALAVNASATNEMPDLSEKGSLTFSMDLGGEPLDGGDLNLYRVADILKIEEDAYDFKLISQLEGLGLDLENMSDPTLAEDLLAAAIELDLDLFSEPITDGSVVFEALDAGLYLVWQGEADATEGYLPIQPFLISVPRWQNDEYALDVVADPKVPLETEPTEPTEPPPPPDDYLPQTGQLNWPVPVMALTGAALFIMGLILCITRKRMGNEK